MINALKSLISFIFILTIFTASFAGSFNPQIFKLNNGLVVVLIEKHSSPVIVHSVWYKCGSFNDPAGKSGLAHAVEHMIYHGTKNIPGEVAQKKLIELGAEFSAFTAHDHVVCYEVIASKDIEEVMKIEADRMSNAQVDEQKFKKEIEVILAERGMRVDNNPEVEGFSYEVAMSEHLLPTNYSNPVIGWEHDIKSISPADINNFYNKWFVPNNAILIIAGDITLNELKKLVEKYYAQIPIKTIENLSSLRSLHKNGVTKEITLRSPKFRNVGNRIQFLYDVSFSPAFNHRKWAALQLVSNYIKSKKGVIQQSLVNEFKNTYGASSWLSCFANQTQMLALQIMPKDFEVVEEAELVLNSLINKLIKEGITSETLESLKNEFIAGFAYTHEDLLDVVTGFGSDLSVGITPEISDSWIEIIKSITANECCEVIREVFSKSPETIIRICPESELHEF